jgi:hypothetical protein
MDNGRNSVGKSRAAFCFRGSRTSEASFSAHAARFLGNSAIRCAGRSDAIVQRPDIPHVA